MHQLVATDPKPPVSQQALTHKELRQDEFWRSLPAYAEVDSKSFHDHRFQSRNSVTTMPKLKEVVGGLVSETFYQDVLQGVRRSSMSLRLSPYILSLINWQDPYPDPLRLQFLPVASQMLPDHPELTVDALHEQLDSPAPGLTHRYFDRALFLALTTCPVYCRFCTRSYAVGLDTERFDKLHFGATRDRWEQAFTYIASRPELEDVIVSGGDVANLKAEQLELIGMRLLEIDQVRRIRFASRGPAVMPQKLVNDDPWVEALTRVAARGRQLHKEVVLHTHFNHPHEITAITKTGLDRLMERGITVRNQTVLQRGVNDTPAVMQLLVRRLSYVNVQPYYVFVHDLVPGVEELRTPLQTALKLEKEVRGLTAGYNTPTFVVDTPGGGGKRDVHSYEHYDRESGISVFASPTVKPGRWFYYFDPLHSLSTRAREAWQDPHKRAAIREAAHRAAVKGR